MELRLPELVSASSWSDPGTSSLDLRKGIWELVFRKLSLLYYWFVSVTFSESSRKASPIITCRGSEWFPDQRKVTSLF